MQDFTGVPAVADLAAMRNALKKRGLEPRIINPLSRVDLVIDHSVMVDQYKSEFSSKKEGFLIQWPNNSSLWGWIIILSQGGNLDAHMHKEGWLSSSIYFERPERKEENEGDIKFSLHGAKYPKNNKDFPEKIIKIEKGDMVIFPSSIFHSTIPFQSQQERITFAFDVIPS